MTMHVMKRKGPEYSGPLRNITISTANINTDINNKERNALFEQTINKELFIHLWNKH